jgi:small GTP-binding protein
METLTKTVRYDFDSLCQDFQNILKHFLVEIQTEKIRGAIAKDVIKQIATQENAILKRLQGNFSLVVVGDFKRGKSTLINALLGEEIVTTNVTPETITINQISYGETYKIEACLTDGGKVSLANEELHSDRLAEVLKQLPQTVKYLDIQAPTKWLPGITLVDTPGTNDIFKQFDSQVHNYLTQADAIIFVISALSPFSESERAFLQFSVVPQDFPKVFFVVNMMDIARNDEQSEKLLNTIQTKVNYLFPNARVFGVSARDEFCRIKSLPRPNIERAETLEKAFINFRETLDESISLNREIIQLNRAINQTDRIVQTLESKIILIRNAMQSDHVSLEEAIAQCQDKSSELFVKIDQHKQQMRAEIEKLSRQACQWMNEFMERLEKEAIATLSQFNLTDIRRHYHFFLSDTLRKGCDRTLDEHRPAILKIVDRAAQEISEDFHNLTEISLDVAQITFGDLQWTNLDTIHLVMEYTPLKLIADLLISQVKESEQSTKTSNYQQKLQAALPELKLSVSRQIQTIYQNVASNLEQQIKIAYQQQIENSLSALQQAQELSNQGEQQITATNEGLQAALLLANETRSSLKEFQEKLWSSL